MKLPPIPTGPDRPQVLVRTYPGHHDQALEWFQIDAEALAAHGYVPVAQSYIEGRYARSEVAAAAVLILIGVGIILLAVMAISRPPGTLAATYLLRG